MLKPRHIWDKLGRAFDSFRVVSLTGARQVGKTTLLRQFCQTRGIPFVSMDDPMVRMAASADPDRWLQGFSGPVAIDEAQLVPPLFAAIKRLVDRDARPGRVFLTGSAFWLHMKTIGESLAGRVALLNLWPLSAAEHLVRRPFDPGVWFDVNWPAGPEHAKSGGTDDPGLVTDLILRGGYPEPAAFESAEQRQLWSTSYLATYLERDVRDLAHLEHLDRFTRMVRLLASRTGQVLNITAIGRELGLPFPTARRYVDWLTTTYQRFDVPAWSPRLGKRLARAPKHYWSDTGLAAALAGWRTWADVEAAAMDGAFVETWVAGELRKWMDNDGGGARLLHWRSHGGGEVDFLIERGGAVVAVEVKWTRRIDARDLRAMHECRTSFGRAFARGIVLYRGSEILTLGERLHAVPLTALLGRPS